MCATSASPGPCGQARFVVGAALLGLSSARKLCGSVVALVHRCNIEHVAGASVAVNFSPAYLLCIDMHML